MENVKRKKKKEREREKRHTTLGVEEHKGLVEGEGVVIRRSVRVVMTRHGLDDEGNETGEEASHQNRSDRPDEDLTADNDATQIHILFLLLLSRSQQPALLCLVQWP